ncbi:MAG: DNA polymerase III subunit alpha [Blastocatellia bacterium]|nr:DNA polymerase III subunit alpha [Blastocatellia bacterium]
MSRKEFVHLHLHTDYSLLDGAIQHDALADYAAQLGFTAMAATDHGNMFGAMQFYNAMKKAGVRPIVGMEAYVARGSRHDRGTNTEGEKGSNHLILLAKSQKGYENLVKLSSLAYTQGYYYKPRMDKELLSEHSEGLVALSACMSGVPSSLILREKAEQALCEVGEYNEIFGQGNYFLELQCHDGFEEQQSKVNAGLTDIARKLNVPLVVTNDAHFLTKDDFRAHQALLCLQTGRTINQASMHYSPGHYVKSAEVMWHLFENQNMEALRNTMRIAEMCQFEFPKAKNHLPAYPVPEGETLDSFFEKVARAGLEERMVQLRPLAEAGALKYPLETYSERLNLEIDTIKKMGFPGYFLIVWDFIRYAKENGIPVGPGRGSAAGSCVAYAMKITDVDPIQFDLLFERFLNPERVSMPDIDVDFCVRGRGKVIDYVGNFYGRENVSQIATFGTMASRAAIKDVGRVLEIEYKEVEKIAKMIPPPQRGRNVPIAEALKTVPELKQAHDSDPRFKEMIELAQRLEGCSRHSSIHAAGVVISPKPVHELVPVFKTKAKDKERGGEIEVLATQYNMNDLEKAGMLKMDFLGLTTLTIIEDCLTNIRRETGQAPDLSAVSFNDPAALKLFADGETEAIFQFEGDGIKEITRRLKPDGLDDIIALNALYRPGPLDSGMVDDYIERRHGRRKVKFDFPELKDILGNTFGVCVTGETVVFDAITGNRYRIDELKDKVGAFYIQGVDSELKPSRARVTHFFANGLREVVEVQLHNGTSVKLTDDHQVLTETGWQSVKELQPGDFIATPRQILVANEQEYDLRKLRVLAYLIADGSLSSTACCDFISKDEALIKEYQRCLQAFERVEARMLQQLRGVTRVGVVGTEKKFYHEPNSVLAWLRELGMKFQKGGCRSENKFIPGFVFGLNSRCIAFFLASLWDCDGHLGKKIYHYKTISKQLALDVQTLLLRLGICSVIYTSHYQSDRREGETAAYQVSVYDLSRFMDLIVPHLVSKSVPAPPLGSVESKDSVSRQVFFEELSKVWVGSLKGLGRAYGLNPQHFRPKNKQIPRIAVQVVRSVAEALLLQHTRNNLNIRWEKITSIKPAGIELVYDITVEGIHNFVGNNIVLHNCTYQEQIMAIFQRLAGYSLGEADLVRRAMGKKKREELDAHKAKFFKQAEERGHDRDKLEKLWQSLEGFADYAFNKCLTGDTPITDAETGAQVTLSQIASREVATTKTFSFDGSQIFVNDIVEAFETGEKEVVEIELEDGRTLRCTLDHKFYTEQGFLPLWEILEKGLDLQIAAEGETTLAGKSAQPAQAGAAV